MFSFAFDGARTSVRAGYVGAGAHAFSRRCALDREGRRSARIDDKAGARAVERPGARHDARRPRAAHERFGGQGGKAVASAAAGLAAPSLPYLAFGTLFLDYDTDRDSDLFAANGHVYPRSAT